MCHPDTDLEGGSPAAATVVEGFSRGSSFEGRFLKARIWCFFLELEETIITRVGGAGRRRGIEGDSRD